MEQLEQRTLMAAAIGDDGGVTRDIAWDAHEFVPNQVIVKLKPTVTADQAGQLRSELGAEVRKEYRDLGIQVWTLPQSVGPVAEADMQTTVRAAIERYSNDARVQYIEPDYVIQLSRTPNDARFGELWGMHNTGQTGGTADADIDAPEAWEIATGSANIVVGVIDTGVDYSHPDLVNNMWRNTGEIAGDGEDNDNNGYVDDVYGWDFANDDNDPMDDVDHGTHVAGTIAAQGDNSRGVVGVNWQARIMALKFLGQFGGTTSGAIGAINYATRMRANLTNNSWGGGGFSQALRDAITAAGAANQVFVAAAGNSNYDNDRIPSYPSGYDNENIISVAASDDNDARAGFSQWGARTVDLAAPGVDIMSTIPVSMGSYGSMSGTSMASPHVAGVAALILSQAPTMLPADLKNLILQSVDRIDDWNGLVLTGGRLNALNALGLISGNRVSVSTTDGLAIETNTNEAPNHGTFRVSLAEAARNNPVIVNYTLTGTAKNSIDYAPLTGSLTIPVGQSSGTITIRPINDTLIEGRETVRLTVQPGGYAVVVGSASMSLDDNDLPPLPTISVTTLDGVAKENNITQPVNRASFRITRTGSTTLPLTVAYGVGGSATNGTDYNQLSGLATIPAERTFVDVFVSAIDDTTYEGTESIVVALSNRLTYRIDPTRKDSNISLLDNDPQDANANDNFVNRVRMFGTSTIAIGANSLATSELNEPNNAGTSGGKTVWWTWNAPQTGTFELSTRGSSFDTTLGVYRGATVDTLGLVAENDDENFARGIFTSKLQFSAVAGRWYHFLVDGFSGDSGDIELRLSQVIGPTGFAVGPSSGTKAGPVGLSNPSIESPSVTPLQPKWIVTGKTTPPASNVGGNLLKSTTVLPPASIGTGGPQANKTIDGLFRSVEQLISDGPERS